jgi:DnaK suppressor protein
MPGTLMPTPDRRRPELVPYLPELRTRLEEEAGVLRRALADIELALHRMSTGRYGSCLHCGANMPVSLLLAIPQADACLTCADLD